MNYLAHALLAGPHPEMVLGGMMGDFVKGRIGDDWPEPLRTGLLLHRRIDRFTDDHPVVAGSRARFTSPRRRFAGIVVDICFDHFLARDFERWSGGLALHDFTSELYALLLANHERLPGRLHHIAPRMAADDWLGAYAHLDGVAAALAGMSRRSPRLAPLADAMADVQAVYEALHGDFRTFYPDLQAFARVQALARGRHSGEHRAHSRPRSTRTMSDLKQLLLDQVEKDRDQLVNFLSRFVQAKTPNPPGDTRDAVELIKTTLDAEGVPYRIVDPKPEFPNVVGSFDGGAPGRHLVLNGHIDCFPVGEHETWTHGPWSGAVADDSIWGRGAADMKCGTTASIWTYIYLHRVREQLAGRLTLTAVSDEETFGPWGARYLVDNLPEVHGDCCLNGEPSTPYTIRFGEKGPLWLRFTVRTRGGHGAYTHGSESATRIAARLVTDLESLESMHIPAPGNVGAILHSAADTTDRVLGAGASDIVQKLTLNIGQIHGGLKVNTIPSECVLEADLRFPVGLEKQVVLDAVETIVARHPQVSMEEMNFQPPAWCDPEHEMVGILQDNVERLRGFRPEPVVSLGGTDTRLWRYRDIPAYVYGPYPTGMGTGDEHVPIEDFLHVLRTHLLSACDYLGKR